MPQPYLKMLHSLTIKKLMNYSVCVKITQYLPHMNHKMVLVLSILKTQHVDTVQMMLKLNSTNIIHVKNS